MSSMGGISGSSAMMMQAMRRPDPAQMAENLFSRLDAGGQGHIEKSDLQSAFDSTSSSSDKSSTIDELFARLDTDSDGKVTKQEFSDTLSKLAEELDNQFMRSRMNDGMSGGGPGGMPPGGMPPGPPPGEQDGGLTKDQLSSAAEAIGSSDSSASSSINDLISNFDEADTNGDGKVSFREAMSFREASASTDASASASASASATDARPSASGADFDARVMMQIVKLIQAYGIGENQSGNGQAANLSVSA